MHARPHLAQGWFEDWGLDDGTIGSVNDCGGKLLVKLTPFDRVFYPVDLIIQPSPIPRPPTLGSFVPIPTPSSDFASRMAGGNNDD